MLFPKHKYFIILHLLYGPVLAKVTEIIDLKSKWISVVGLLFECTKQSKARVYHMLLNSTSTLVVGFVLYDIPIFILNHLWQ